MSHSKMHKIIKYLRLKKVGPQTIEIDRTIETCEIVNRQCQWQVEGLMVYSHCPTQTKTDTDKMCTESNGNLHQYLSE